MADPILPSPPFPLDTNRTPYVSSADSAGKHTVPASNWFYDATTNLWLPVTSTRGLPIVPKKSDGTEILTDAAPGSVKVTGRNHEMQQIIGTADGTVSVAALASASSSFIDISKYKTVAVYVVSDQAYDITKDFSHNGTLADQGTSIQAGATATGAFSRYHAAISTNDAVKFLRIKVKNTSTTTAANVKTYLVGTLN